jgi:putative membrane protein
MAADHGKAGQELSQLAQQKGLRADAKDAAHERLRSRLQKLSGEAFDKAYVKEMVKDHEQDVREFRRMSQKASDADVKAFAAKTLPTLEDHLRAVKDLDKQVNARRAAAR